MINFKFADIGEGIHEGVILKWLYDVGDQVEEGETMVVVETDKVNAEIPAPEDGILKKQGAKVGETIHVGEVLAVIDDGSSEEQTEEKTDEQPEDDSDEVSENKTEEKGEEEEETASVVGSVEVSNDVLPDSDEHSKPEKKEQTGKVLATPVARKMAKDLGVDINTLKGSGPNGRVMKSDIKAAAEASSEPSKQAERKTRSSAYPSMPKMPERGVRREKISKLRQSIVRAMDTSNQLIPATTVMDEFDVTELVRFREEQKGHVKDQGTKLTYLPLILKAVILTLKEYPIFNASYDHETEEIIYKDFFNIGIAVDTEDGLIVPNIKDADQKSILELAKEIGVLATKARERKLSLAELKNTTFSVTNYGAFGAKLGTPVINHPEVAILGMGAITKKPVVVDDEIKVRDIFPVSLSVDHRIIDGGDAGRFMVKLKAYLNDPMLLLLS